MYTLREVRTTHTRCVVMYVVSACMCVCEAGEHQFLSLLMRNCIALFVKFISYIAVLRVYLSTEFRCVCIGIYVLFFFCESLIPAMDKHCWAVVYRPCVHRLSGVEDVSAFP